MASLCRSAGGFVSPVGEITGGSMDMESLRWWSDAVSHDLLGQQCCGHGRNNVGDYRAEGSLNQQVSVHVGASSHPCCLVATKEDQGLNKAQVV